MHNFEQIWGDYFERSMGSTWFLYLFCDMNDMMHPLIVNVHIKLRYLQHLMQMSGDMSFLNSWLLALCMLAPLTHNGQLCPVIAKILHSGTWWCHLPHREFNHRWLWSSKSLFSRIWGFWCDAHIIPQVSCVASLWLLVLKLSLNSWFLSI